MSKYTCWELIKSTKQTPAANTKIFFKVRYDILKRLLDERLIKLYAFYFFIIIMYHLDSILNNKYIVFLFLKGKFVYIKGIFPICAVYVIIVSFTLL